MGPKPWISQLYETSAAEGHVTVLHDCKLSTKYKEICVLVDYVFVVVTLVGNKSYTVERLFISLLNVATFVRNMHLWDEQQSRLCGLFT